jgi:hypothetical protein
MNGIDEFIELSLGLFAVLTGLIVLLTYMERTLNPKANDSAQPVNDKPGRDRRHPTVVAPSTE